MRYFAHTLLAAACALALSACGGSSGSTYAVDAQSKQLHRSTKATGASYAASVQELYVAYFGRPADPAGLTNFENELAAANAPTDILGLAEAYGNNPQITALVNSFETSAESQALYGSGTTKAFVTAIFQNVLGRQPAQAGLDFWVNAIDSGQLTQGDAALSIMAGALKNNTAQGVLDAQLINNRLAVADYFTSSLTAKNLVNAYTGHTAAGVARSMLNAVGASTDVTSFESTTVAGSLVSLVAPVNVTLDKTSLSYASFSGNTPAAQSINMSISGGTATFYGRAVSDQPLMQAFFTETTNSGAVISVAVNGAAPASASGSINIELCTDSTCNVVVWSQPVPYTVSSFTISSSAITISGNEGAAAPTATIAVSPADTTGKLAITTVSNNSTNWLSATDGANGISVVASGAGLAAGSYQGSVNISIAGLTNSPSVSVPVSFTVGDGIVAPAAISINMTGTSTIASLNGSAALSFKASQNASWTATSDSAWLVLSNATGTGAGSFKYSVDPTSAASLANWASSTANVTISAAGYTSVKVPVTLNKKLPEIYSVSPAEVVAGRATTVQLLGRGLSQLSGVNQIAVAGISGATGSITSDTGAVLNLPALPVGRTAVSVSNTAAITTRSSTIGAANLSALPYAYTAGTGDLESALFDPSRNTLYTNNTTTNTLQRYHFTGSQWQVDGVPISQIGDMAFSPDRGTLYVISGSATMLAIDPDTLQTKGSYAYPVSAAYPSIGQAIAVSGGLAVTNNMRIWLNAGNWLPPSYFDLINSTFVIESGNSSAINGMFYTPSYYASGDGSRMFVVQPGATPQFPDVLYVTASDTFSSPSSLPPLYLNMSLSYDGSVVTNGGYSLYNAVNFSLIGTPPASSNVLTLGIVSPDGKRLYQMETNGPNSLTVDHVNIYDTTQVQSSNSTFVKLGQIAVTDQAAACPPQNQYCDDSRGGLVISPLGDTLFWFGNQGVVALPIPTAMSGVKSEQRRLLKAKAR